MPLMPPLMPVSRFNKKADEFGERAPEAIFYTLLTLGVIIFSLYIVIQYDRSAYTKPNGFDNWLIMERAVLSQNCFAYQDGTGRVYDKIDLRKFTDETLKSCMVLGDYPYEFKFKLSLAGVNKDIVAETDGWYGDSVKESSGFYVVVKDEAGDESLEYLNIDIQDSDREVKEKEEQRSKLDTLKSTIQNS